MLVYMDLEHTGSHIGTSMISIGCISEDGRTFYGECSDYDTTQVDSYIVDNIISNLDISSIQTEQGLPVSTLFKSEDINGFCTKTFGTNKEVGKDLKSWLFQFDTVQFVGDRCLYDFILLIDSLSGNLSSLPSFVSEYCHDINQDIARYFNITDKEAYMINRDDIVEIEYEDKHNALYNALLCKSIYEKVSNINE